MTVEVPPELHALPTRGAAWPIWLDALPQLIRTVMSEWSLAPEGPARSGRAGLMVPVLAAVGEPALVKFGWPHPEAQHEHLALRLWAGRGAVRLVRADPRRSVLLLERADVSRDLTSLPILGACEVVAGLYQRIHRPSIPQLDRLSVLAFGWAEALGKLRADGRVPRRYLDQAAALAMDFATDPQIDTTLLHTDLSFDKVLAADRGALAGDQSGTADG